MKVEVHSAKMRGADDLIWCALCHGKEFVYWADGKLVCYESKLETKDSRLIVTDCCVAEMPEYKRGLRVDGFGTIPSTTMPVARASATAEKILKEALKLIKARE